MSILEVKNLVKSYRNGWWKWRKVVDQVSFDVEPGEVVGLLGPNGAGKTTSFRMTTGQLPPDDGRVFFNNIDVTHLPMYKRARLGLGYLSQQESVFRRLTVEQNVLAILEARPWSRMLGRRLTRSERWDRTDRALAQFGLTHVRKTNAARASGGEKRRLEIARCLVCEPVMILLDEPFAGVDPLTKNDIRKIVRDLAQTGISILLTDHDVDQVLDTADRIFLITRGQVRTVGRPEDIVRDPVAIQEYLGDRYINHTFINGVRTAQPHRSPPDHQHSPAVVPPVRHVLDYERARELVNSLMGDENQFRESFTELAQRPDTAVPALIEALERRDMEMRRRAYLVLQRLVSGTVDFDPFAPEPLRRQQVTTLRERLGRRAA
jgi:lipopolysaccharide export system ATP-binding protein